MASIYDSPADLNLMNTYAPLPFEQLAGAMERKQGRYDAEAERMYAASDYLGQFSGAGHADNEYLREIKEGFAREVTDEFQYGQVDLTDPVVSSRLRQRINQFTNDPTLNLIQSNEQLYPQLHEQVSKAIMSQPQNPWNYQEALMQMNLFEQYGTKAVGNLRNVHVPEPVDVFGNLASVVNDFKASGLITDHDISLVRERKSEEGVGLERLRHAFGLNKKTGEVENIPYSVRNTALFGELLRAAEYFSDGSPESIESELNDLYRSAIGRYLEAYAWNKESISLGLGSIVGTGLEDGPVRYTTMAAGSALGFLNERPENLRDSSKLNSQVADIIRKMIPGGAERVDDLISTYLNDIMDTHPTAPNVGELVGEARDKFSSDLEEHILGSIEEMTRLLIGPISGIVPKGADISSIFIGSWRGLLKQHGEDIFDLSLMFLPETNNIERAKEAVIGEEQLASLARIRQTVPNFDNLSVTDKYKEVLKQTMLDANEISQIHIIVPDSNDPDIIKRHQEGLNRQFLGDNPGGYTANSIGDLRGSLPSKTVFVPSGEEFKLRDVFDNINTKGGIHIEVLGELSPINPFGPGYFVARFGETEVYFKGNEATTQREYDTWALHSYARSFNGIGKDRMTIMSDGKPIQIYSVQNWLNRDNPGELELRYIEDGQEKVFRSNVPNDDIMTIYMKFEEQILNK